MQGVPEKLSVSAYMAAVAGSVRASLLASLLLASPSYPAWGRATVFSTDWVAEVILRYSSGIIQDSRDYCRNLVFTWAVCGGWDWFLYCSPLSGCLARYKITPRYPALAQFRHDATFTSLARYPGFSESCSWLV